MTLPLAMRLRASPLPARIVAVWETIAARWHPVAVIVIAWALLALPPVFWRGYFAHEGLAVTIARMALETGDWVTPHLFNIRFVERPTLQSWIIEAISAPFGSVSQITARLPSAAFLLFGCLLIYALLRKVAASVPAAVLGAASFLACPLVIRHYVMVIADLPLAVTLFLAFYLWWGGNKKGAIGLGRWLAIGVVLAFAGLFKGPQPIAYFALGIGLYVLGSRSWRQIPGLILAGLICVLPLAAWYWAIYTPGDAATWGSFMRLKEPYGTFAGPLEESVRLLFDTLPATLLAAGFLIARAPAHVREKWIPVFRKGHAQTKESGAHPDLIESGCAPGERGSGSTHFVAALASYAFVAALLMLFWPAGSASRYYLPMVPPLCVLGGLGYDVLARRRPEIVAPILLITAALLLYALGYAAASPFFPKQYRDAALDGARMTALVQAAPAPIYWSGDVALNILPYVPGQIRNVSSEDLAKMPGPAWIVVAIPNAEALIARRPGTLHAVIPLGDREQWRLLRLDP
jgi:4-amino-4-deoxy-L-arabinose transferase-like glycosyltransferase